MSKFKLFIENFLIYGIGGVISKIVPLIMVPIITRLMPNTEYYGISDLYTTVIQIASALAIMGMYDAMYRMFFEKEEHEFQTKVCSTAFMFTIFSSLVICLVMCLLRKPIAQVFFDDPSIAYLVYIAAMATLIGSTNSIVSAPTRMQNQRGIYLIANTVSPILSYGIAIPLLLKGYYILALPIASVISAVTMELSFYGLNHKWFSFKKFDFKLLKQMLVIAVPLLPNFLIYWVFNSSDKVMITNLLNVGEAGIYSVGSKLGHASQLIYTAFAGGWQYFAFSTMKEKDQVKTNSSIFEYLGAISFVTSAFICAFSYWIFKILFTEEYLSGYIVAPYLFLAPLLQMLFQVACNQFIVVKKTWFNMVILAGGALLNVVLNLVLIPILGMEGAAIATLCGYVVSNIVCIIVLCCMKLMIISKRMIASVIFITAYFVLWRLLFPDNIIIGTLSAVALTLIYILMYKKDLSGLLKSAKCKNNNI